MRARAWTVAGTGETRREGARWPPRRVCPVPGTHASRVWRDVSAVRRRPRTTSGLLCSRGSCGGDLVVADAFVTQREAAELAGCSKDTIIRARGSGHFPHARLRGHAWTLPIDDLIAAGLYDPIRDSESDIAPAPDDVDATSVTVDLARALARVAALEDVLARQDDELRFLRQLTADSLAKTGTR